MRWKLRLVLVCVAAVLFGAHCDFFEDEKSPGQEAREFQLEVLKFIRDSNAVAVGFTNNSGTDGIVYNLYIAADCSGDTLATFTVNNGQTSAYRWPIYDRAFHIHRSVTSACSSQVSLPPAYRATITDTGAEFSLSIPF